MIINGQQARVMRERRSLAGYPAEGETVIETVEGRVTAKTVAEFASRTGAVEVISMRRRYVAYTQKLVMRERSGEVYEYNYWKPVDGVWTRVRRETGRNLY